MFQSSRQKRMTLLAASLATAALLLSACGGGTNGINGANGTNGTNGTNGANGGTYVNVANMTAAQWASLKPAVDPSSISVTWKTNCAASTASAPVTSCTSAVPTVNFKVTTSDTNQIVLGLGTGKSYNSSTGLTTYNNVAFTMAKLVAANASSQTLDAGPSNWVSYNVIKPVAGASAATYTWAATYPSTDNAGTLVDNNDGTYSYTFLRDLGQVQSILNGLSYTAPQARADLGNVTFDPTATTRVGIMISGNQPGTGTNTPTGATSTTAAVAMVSTLNAWKDVRPDGSAMTTSRVVVAKDACSDCHDGRGIGHISNVNGDLIGRNDPNFCVTCHTNQAMFGLANNGNNANPTDQTLVTAAPAGQTLNTTGTFSYFRAPDNTAAFIYPRMIHQTHMGSRLVKQGYNLNNHWSFPYAAGSVGNAVAGKNPAQLLNSVQLPQDVSNCTKCHDATRSPQAGVTGVAQANNWFNNPTRLACGSCHDGINFALGTGTTVGGTTNYQNSNGHGGGIPGPQNDDSKCSTCHQPSDIQLYHRTVNATPNNIAGAGPNTNLSKALTNVATVSYNLGSVSVNKTTGQPTFLFQILVNGSPVQTINAANTVINPLTGAPALDPNYAPITYTDSTGTAQKLFGGPTFEVAFNVPQDGIATPADYNGALSTSLGPLMIAATDPGALTIKSGTVTGWNKSSSTAIAPVNGNATSDSNGWFSATLTGTPLYTYNKVTLPKTGATTCAFGGGGTYASTTVNPAPIAIPTTAPNASTIVSGIMMGTFTQSNATGFAAYVPNQLCSSTTFGSVSSAGGVLIKPQLQLVTATGYTARRVTTSAALCNKCHEQLGTVPPGSNNGAIAEGTNGFHGGVRNDPTACPICHTVNRADGTGFPADSSTFFHGIHGGNKRTTPFVAAQPSPLGWASAVNYPGILKDCGQCHLPGAVNFATYASQLPNMLFSTAINGQVTSPTNDGTIASKNSPEVAANGTRCYGNAFTFVAPGAVAGSYTPSTIASAPVNAVSAVCAPAVPAQTASSPAPAGTGTIIPADPATLVNSPISSACYSCHDTASDKSHMQGNGGVLYTPRSAIMSSTGAIVNNEQCLLCHGQTKVVDVQAVHAPHNPN